MMNLVDSFREFSIFSKSGYFIVMDKNNTPYYFSSLDDCYDYIDYLLLKIEKYKEDDVGSDYLHGFYSQEASDKFGCSYNLNKEGDEVCVSALYRTIEEGVNNYKWKDSYYVGLVKKYPERFSGR